MFTFLKSCDTKTFVALLLLSGTAWAHDVSPSQVSIERFAAERGDADSQYFMGEHYELGDSGVEKDLEQALNWYERAAKQNHAAAQFKVGQFYERGGTRLPRDPEMAKEWYRRAASKGNRQAQQRMAEMEQAQKDQERREREESQRRAVPEKKQNMAPPSVAVSVAAAPVKKEKKSSFDPERLLTHVISGKWYEANNYAEFLPSGDMSCLKTKESEITCFSKERKRIVADTELTFSVKSVLSRFEDESFDVTYMYNVSDTNKAAQKSAGPDDYGLLSKEGWQQPGLNAKCQVKEPGRLECRRAQGNSKEYRIK